VVRARCVVGIAPYEAAGLDFFDGMDPLNVTEFGWALAGEDRLVPELERELRWAMELTTWPDAWRPPIVRTVALRAEGVAELDETIVAHRAHLVASGSLAERRGRRARSELERVVQERVAQEARAKLGDARYRALLDDVAAHRVDPWTAADRLLRAE